MMGNQRPDTPSAIFIVPDKSPETHAIIEDILQPSLLFDNLESFEESLILDQVIQAPPRFPGIQNMPRILHGQLLSLPTNLYPETAMRKA
jgi:hypothetical protein